MAGDISIGITKQKLRSSKTPLPEEDDPDDPFSGEGGCLGGKTNQIFWYIPMGNPGFGIHMDAAAFEKLYQSMDMESKNSCFIHGILSIAAMYIMFEFYIATSKGKQPIMAKVIWLQVFQMFFEVILVYNIMFH